MKRRYLLKSLAAAPLLIAPAWRGWAATPARGSAGVEALQISWKDFLAQRADVALTTEPLKRSKDEWKKILTPAQYRVLREVDT
jgi:peptide-methionine (R)-S-oxide reductase